MLKVFDKLKRLPVSPQVATEPRNEEIQQLDVVVEPAVPEKETRTPEELMASLAPSFYQEGFQPLDYIFSKIPEDLNEDWLNAQIEEHEQIKEVIESTRSDRVLRSYGAFVEGMSQIQQLGVDLQLTTFLCKASRQKLAHTKEELTKSSFFILSQTQRKATIQGVVSHLEDIQHVVDMEKKLSDTVESGDYPAAIEMCTECKNRINASHTLPQFYCVRGINSHIQENYSVIQKKLHASLLEMCAKFQPDTYERVLIAYRLLGKTNRVVDKLQRHFLASINTNTQNVLNAHVFSSEENLSHAEKLNSMKFRDLCSYLKEEHFISCLRTMLECLTDIMYCHHRMCSWHKQCVCDSAENGNYFDQIRVGIEGFRKTIWAEMQRKVSALMATANLSNFQMDQFLTVLKLINQISEIGDDFSGSKSHSLIGSIKKQCKAYFASEHQSRLEDLPTIMEAENWERMPVKSSYSPLDIKEFKMFLKKQVKEGGDFSTEDNGAPSFFSSCSLDDVFVNPFRSLPSVDEDEEEPEKELGANGFNKVATKAADGEEEIDPRLLASYVDEGDGTPPPVVPAPAAPSPLVLAEGRIVTSTAIRFLQYIGKYLHMMEVLQPISFEVFVGVTHMFQYYMYTVYQFFGNPGTEDQFSPMHAELNATLGRIGSQLLHQPGSEKKKFAIEIAHRSMGLDLGEGNIFGLCERIIASESLGFMAEAMNCVKAKIKALIPQSRQPYFSKFYSLNVDLISELQVHLYRTACSPLIDLEPFVQKIAAVKWDINDVGVEHNTYVNALLKDFQLFDSRIGSVTQKGCVTEKVRDALWEVTILKAMNVLVEGFSRARRCSWEGRGLMKLDFQTFQTGLIKMSPIKPLPGAQKVDTFIISFYEPETSMAKWIQEHYSEYTSKQLTGLIQVCPFKQRKTRQELLQIIQDLDKEKDPTVKKNVVALSESLIEAGNSLLKGVSGGK